MIEYAGQPRTQVLILNQSTTYYLSAIAVAIGFQMNLFNIGVDGQYRLAAIAGGRRRRRRRAAGAAARRRSSSWWR